MNHISIGISSIGIGCTTVLIASLYLFWFNFHDFARIRGASNYIGICKKTIFLQGHPLAESAMLYENKLHTVQLSSSILTREGNEPWSYRPFQSKQIAVDQNKKYLHHTTIKNNLPYHVIFHWYGIQPHHSAVILTICMLLFINCSLLIIFNFKSHHGDFLYFAFHRKITKLAFTQYRAERENLNFGLRLCRILFCDYCY